MATPAGAATSGLAATLASPDAPQAPRRLSRKASQAAAALTTAVGGCSRRRITLEERDGDGELHLAAQERADGVDWSSLGHGVAQIAGWVFVVCIVYAAWRDGVHVINNYLSPGHPVPVTNIVPQLATFTTFADYVKVPIGFLFPQVSSSDQGLGASAPKLCGYEWMTRTHAECMTQSVPPLFNKVAECILVEANDAKHACIPTLDEELFAVRSVAEEAGEGGS